MTKNCEKCGKKPACVHITEMMDGIMLERDLCEKCANVHTSPQVLPLAWKCHCGKSVQWRFKAPDCPHNPSNYVPAGEVEQEVAVCSCGMHFIARFTVWRCQMCGCTSLFPPRLGGEQGFLRDYIYGSTHTAKVEIKGVKGDAEK
ncbi:MAG TPA: hypothetical protein ENN09_02435 [Planctomycetes bacterium]|nr:hypothetical protein [Planctomycetota bacterium]